MLILETKFNEKIILQDSNTGINLATIKLYRRDRGGIALAFDAAKSIKISRKPIIQGSVDGESNKKQETAPAV